MRTEHSTDIDMKLKAKKFVSFILLGDVLFYRHRPKWDTPFSSIDSPVWLFQIRINFIYCNHHCCSCCCHGEKSQRKHET